MLFLNLLNKIYIFKIGKNFIYIKLKKSYLKSFVKYKTIYNI